MTLLLCILALAGIGIALWSTTRGEGSTVVGAGNSFDAYYGKDRWNPGKSPPCDNCRPLGCIGAGSCSCRCHRPTKKK